MKSITLASERAIVDSPQTATGRQIRGSSLLVAGRIMSAAANFTVQLLIVRQLSKTDYGAFAYALSIVALGEMFVSLGLDRAISRFVPIYHEQGDDRRLLGVVLVAVTGIVLSGFALVLMVWAFQGTIAQVVVKDPQAVALLLILIVLSPVQALDVLITNMFAIFAGPRSIFLRKHVLAPVAKLAVVGLLLFMQGDVLFLATGYLVIGVLEVAIYLIILARMLGAQGLLQRFSLRAARFPAREVFAFALPLLTIDLMYITMNSLDAVFLERFHGVAEVAAYRAVQPAARLNHLVFTSFGLLFTPMAARLFARNDRDGINDLYWRTAIWIAVLSFPMFALTVSLAQPLTIFLYGTRYEQSAVVLALLSFGYYFDAALGQNNLALRVIGKVRLIVTLHVLAMVVNLGLNLLLIPRYGALGAAIGTGITLVARNLGVQAALLFNTGIRSFERRYLKVYVVIALSALGLFLLHRFIFPGAYAGLALAALATLLVVGLNRKLLNIARIFPELLRFPGARRLFGEKEAIT